MENMVRMVALVMYIFATAASARLLTNPEVDALSAFRLTVEDPQNILRSWDATSADPCDWYFVTCNNDRKVDQISLFEKAGLGGTISPSLGDLSSLRVLDLSGNSFSGNIPAELGSITSLRSLRLQGNSLSGSIPSELTHLANLVILDLSDNDLSGSIPTGGSFSHFSSTSFAGNPHLCGAVINKPC